MTCVIKTHQCSSHFWESLKFTLSGNEMHKTCLFCTFSWASVMLAELAIEAGLPDVVLNIVHGTHVSFTIFLA